jgi:peptidoglycan hydrolase-like protein with peptidoglycan-binding domain
MGDGSPRAEKDTLLNHHHEKRVARPYRRQLAQGWSAETWTQYGRALKEDGKLSSAAYAFAMALANRLADAHLKAGHVHQGRGDTQEAIHSYKLALKFNPEKLDATDKLRALGVLEEEITSLIERGTVDRHDIDLELADRVLAARFKSGPARKRYEWGGIVAAVAIVLFLVWGGTAMLIGTPLETAQDTNPIPPMEIRKLTVGENIEVKAPARQAADQNAVAEAVAGKVAQEQAARKEAEEKTLAEATARKAAEEWRLRETAAQRVAAEEALADAAARRMAEEKASTEAAARRAAEQKLAAEDARLKAEEATRNAEEALRAAEAKPKSAAELKEQAEKAEGALNLSEQERKRVQVALNSLGYEFPTATGFFGPRTRAAITAWQKKQGLPETGYLDASQLAALQKQVPQAKRADEAKLAPGQQAEKAEAALNLSEQERKRVQVALNALGQEMPTITGFFGPRTRAAITAWQKAQGLPETGYLTEAQWATLRQQAIPALAKYDQVQSYSKEE